MLQDCATTRRYKKSIEIFLKQYIAVGPFTAALCQVAARLSTAAGSPQQITEPSPRRSFWSWNPCLGIALRCSWWINVSTCFLQWIHMDSWWFMQSLELWNRCQKMVTHGDAITCSTVGKTHIVVEAVGRTSLISLYLLYIYIIYYLVYTPPGLAAARRMWNFEMTGAVQIAPWHGPRGDFLRSVEVPRTDRPGEGKAFRKRRKRRKQLGGLK